MHEHMFSPHFLAPRPSGPAPVATRPSRRPDRRRARVLRRAAAAATVVLAGAGLGTGVARADGTPRPPVLTITATDFRLTAPATATSGLTRIRLVNRGSEGHQAALVRLKEGHTSGQFLGALAQGFGTSRAHGTFVGGPNAAAPGQTAEATSSLRAGHYLVVCLIPSASDGTPHVMKGMLTELDVGGRARPHAQPPAPVIETSEYHFRFPATARRALAVGRAVEVRNAGSQIHEVVIARLQPGTTVSDVAHSADHPIGTACTGPQPDEEIAGVTELAPGGRARMRADLRPGRYALLCFLPDDAHPGTSHLHQGMAYPFTVG